MSWYDVGSSREEIMSQAKRLLEERAQARRTTSAWGGGEGRSYPVGRVSFGPEKPWTEEDAERLAKQFEDGVVEAFERVLKVFCTELTRAADRQSYKFDRMEFQDVVCKTRDQIPVIVKKALTEEE
jgi:hypothetical protein